MRRLFVIAVALGAIAWSGTAWAITVDTQPKTPAGPETPGKTVQLTFKDDGGKTVVKKTAKVDEKGHVQVSLTDEERKKAKKLDVVVPPGKGEKTEYKKNDIVIPPGAGDISLGEIGLTAVAITVAPKPSSSFRISENETVRPQERVYTNYNYFQFGFGMGEDWTKTSANDFGTGLGGSTIFDHTFSSTFLALNAGFFVPVFPGVAFGPVVQLVSGDIGGGNGVSLTTPSGIVGTSLVRRDYAVDAMGRIIINSAITPFGFNVFVEGGGEFARYTGSMVNSGVETFQNSASTTSPIVGGGITFPLCPLLVPSMNGGVCTIQGSVEYDHAFVDHTFFTGLTGLSSATASVKGEDRVMGGILLSTDVYHDFVLGIKGRVSDTATSNVKLDFGNFLSPSDIRLKRDIAEVGHLDNGLGLYSYRYWWSDQVYVGVMAQEVAQVVPDAVMMAPDGYLRVNYAKLGTHLQTYEEWVAAGRPHESY